jgi:hypothetical protein
MVRLGLPDGDHEAADRISAAAEANPDSDTARSGFDHRAQTAADRNAPYDDDYE